MCILIMFGSNADETQGLLHGAWALDHSATL